MDLVSERQGTGAGRRDPRQEGRRGGYGLARDLDGGGCPPSYTAGQAGSVQAARPGPWKWFLGMPRPPPQEAQGS